MLVIVCCEVRVDTCVADSAAVQGRIMVPPGPEAYKRLRAPQGPGPSEANILEDRKFSLWKFRGPKWSYTL